MTVELTPRTPKQQNRSSAVNNVEAAAGGGIARAAEEEPSALLNAADVSIKRQSGTRGCLCFRHPMEEVHGESPVLPPASQPAGQAAAESQPAGDSGALVHVSSAIATRRKKMRAVCGICLQEDSLQDGWMQRCASCDACVHFHCARALGLPCDVQLFKCGACSSSEASAASCCMICLRKLSSKTVCVVIPVIGSDSGAAFVHAPCLLLSRSHRLAPPPALPLASPAAISRHPVVESAGARCCVCRGESGEMQPCMHVGCGKCVHASCAGDLKLLWLATARDRSAFVDGPTKLFTACSMKHIKQDQVFCTCWRPYDPQGSTMIQCDDCRGWFHCDCLAIDDKEDELDALQAKQFRCPECIAKVSQAQCLHPPVFMCDVRRQWSLAPMLLPPKPSAPPQLSALPLTSQPDVVSALTADMLLLILQTPQSNSVRDLRVPTCVACLAPVGHRVSSAAMFSTLARRLCAACCTARQTLLYLCVPTTCSSLDTQSPVHPKALLVLSQAVQARDSSSASPDLAPLFQKQ